MKLNRTYIFIAISSVALLIVLIIQVNWILQTAKIKEELFNEKANMVLARTTEALLSDKETTERIGDCIDNESAAGLEPKLAKSDTRMIDSLFTHYMKFYNFHINYSFSVAKQKSFSTKTVTSFANANEPACYEKGLEEITNTTDIELKLVLPDKKQFIIAEMGTMFVTSILLILIVLILFWRTVLSLLKEKRISEHTTDFLNNMTHEFKTPLTNIALAGKMIVKGLNNNQEDKIKHYSEIILEENDKLRLQVEQVLSMTALERGEIPLQKTELNFHDLITNALKSISIQIENKQGQLTLKLNANQFVILGDKNHLTNAMCNLIDNAIKYSEQKPELLIETYNNAQHLIIIVSDKGIGIEKKYHKNVFDKFFRVPTGDIHNVKGFGLGLAYIKTIIELHKGTIELQSEKGKGTVFTITLPNA